MTPAAVRLAWAHRAALLASVTAVTAAAWVWLTRGSGHASHLSLMAPHCAAQAGINAFLAAVIMWQAMTVAMMTPTTMNWLFAYAALVEKSEPGRAWRRVAAFALGYFTVWLGYSAAGAGLQIALARWGLLDHAGRAPARAAGIVLMAAGIVYFTPLSRACLRHCRNPLTYFLERWDRGPRGGFGFGAAHGAYCVGCCWALMLTGFAMGVMNLAWMAVLTALVCVEKLAPFGPRIGGAASIGLIAWGVWLIA